MIHTIKTDNWSGSFSTQEQRDALSALEKGDIIYFPSLPFPLESQEDTFLSPHFGNSKSKNISYDSHCKKIGGTHDCEHDLSFLKTMLARYATQSQILLESLLPLYKKHLQKARTSFRPAEIFGRESSYRKDDTRLHVDAFPSAPVQGNRILRVFTNINPHGQNRLWRLGEPFHSVVERFAPQCHKPLPGSSWLLKTFHITKSKRTPYDHYMLQLHNAMKADKHYQNTAQQIEFSFPPGSTWIVFTDATSHAAMQGQYALEQTFYLPVKGMSQPEISPLKILENFLGSSLVCL